jgi:hypothetical protein
VFPCRGMNSTHREFPVLSSFLRFPVNGSYLVRSGERAVCAFRAPSAASGAQGGASGAFGFGILRRIGNLSRRFSGILARRLHIDSTSDARHCHQRPLTRNRTRPMWNAFFPLSHRSHAPQPTQLRSARATKDGTGVEIPQKSFDANSENRDSGNLERHTWVVSCGSFLRSHRLRPRGVGQFFMIAGGSILDDR